MSETHSYANNEHLSMKKTTIKEILKFLRDLALLFAVCMAIGAVDGWFDEQFFWILCPILSVVGAVFCAIGRMKIGSGERSTYPLCDQMDDYYAKSKNYVEIQAEIKDIVLNDKKNLLMIVVSVDDVLCEEYELDKEQSFAVVYQDQFDLNLSVCDIIQFTTAPQKYFGKHIPPILSLSKDNVTIINLKQGKENYRRWIRENIK